MSKILVFIFMTLSMNVSANEFLNKYKKVNYEYDVLIAELNKNINCFHHIKLINRIQ